LNPAVTAGLTAAGRFEMSKVPGYVIAQVLGAIVASACLLVILKGGPDAAAASLEGVANGYGEHSPGKYSLLSALIGEFVLTFIFLTVILGATSSHAVAGLAGLAIGLTLTLVHLVGIPVTNLSVNPARSTGPALLTGGWAIAQLWLFWVSPVAGGVLAGLAAKFLHADDQDSADA
jgi:aquaporin Z